MLNLFNFSIFPFIAYGHHHTNLHKLLYHLLISLKDYKSLFVLAGESYYYHALTAIIFVNATNVQYTLFLDLPNPNTAPCLA